MLIQIDVDFPNKNILPSKGLRQLFTQLKYEPS